MERLGPCANINSSISTLGLSPRITLKIIFQRLFPNCMTIDGCNTSLPTVGILLLSRVSLHEFSLSLASTLFSLIVIISSHLPTAKEVDMEYLPHSTGKRHHG